MSNSSRSKKDILFLYLIGMSMGAADSLPGVSGGTIAFITNIYEELIQSLRSFDLKLISIFKKKGIKGCWEKVNGNFLLILFAGILSSLILLANLVLYFLEYHEQILFSFFSGLIIASFWFIARQSELKFSMLTWSNYLVFLIGLTACISLSFIPVQHVEPDLLYYFFGGALAICAMILPGISGAFILLLLGLYIPVLDALTNVKVQIILVFVSGCATGLLAFSRLLNWLFKHYHQGTLLILMGVLLGSLVNLWPWKKGTSFRTDHSGELEAIQFVPVLPAQYTEITGNSVNLLMCSIFFLIGLFLVIGLELVAGKKLIK